MKIKTFKKILILSVASLLSLQAVHAQLETSMQPPSDWNAENAQAWQTLQDYMSYLTETTSSILSVEGAESLLDAQAHIINYQINTVELREAQRNGYVPTDNADAPVNIIFTDGLSLNCDLYYTDLSNPAAFAYPFVEFGSFENELLNARVGSATIKTPFLENFDRDTASLVGDLQSDFSTLYADLLNADPNNPAEKDQINKDIKAYHQNSEKLHKKANHYKKLELKNAVTTANLTGEEMGLWTQFQSTLTAKYKASCKNYFNEMPATQGVTDPIQLEANLIKEEDMNATAYAFKLLEQGCLYEFLNVLLTKRNDADSSLNSFHQLQEKLSQFLSNVDVHNPIALLQAQVDMLAYETEVGVCPAKPVVK